MVGVFSFSNQLFPCGIHRADLSTWIWLQACRPFSIIYWHWHWCLQWSVSSYAHRTLNLTKSCDLRTYWLIGAAIVIICSSNYSRLASLHLIPTRLCTYWHRYFWHHSFIVSPASLSTVLLLLNFFTWFPRSGKKYGDDALEVAPVFYHYAHALLTKVQEV